MSNTFHRYLRLPFKIKRPTFPNGSENNYHLSMPGYVDKNVNTWIKSLGLTLSGIEAFYTPPTKEIPIHCDSSTLDNHVKINITWGAKDGCVKWWECSTTEPIGEPHTVTENGTSYRKYPEGLLGKNCQLLFTASTNSPSLLNVGQMHSTYNPSNTEGRWTLCFIPKHIKSDSPYVYWDEALNIFKDYIRSEEV